LGAWAGDDGTGVAFCKDGDMEFVAAEAKQHFFCKFG
jgi:hypothetical protein